MPIEGRAAPSLISALEVEAVVSELVSAFRGETPRPIPVIWPFGGIAPPFLVNIHFNALQRRVFDRIGIESVIFNKDLYIYKQETAAQCSACSIDRDACQHSTIIPTLDEVDSLGGIPISVEL